MIVVIDGKMKTIRKVNKVGDSLMITLGKDVVEELKLMRDDYVEVDIIKSKKDGKIRCYRCRVCELRFDSADSELYCPACSSEGEAIEEIWNNDSQETKLESENIVTSSSSDVQEEVAGSDTQDPYDKSIKQKTIGISSEEFEKENEKWKMNL